MKLCSKCGVEKPVSEFHKNKKTKDGLQGYCKQCRRRETTITRDNNRHILYQKGMLRCSLCGVIKSIEEFNKAADKRSGFRSHCKKCLSKKYKNDFDRISKNNKRYRESHRSHLNKSDKERKQSKTKSRVLFKQLVLTDNPSIDQKGFVEVRCYFCHNQFLPTYSQICSRIQAIKSNRLGESNFYCSGACKDSCPTYHFDTTRQIDPRSKLYTPPTEAEKARAKKTDKLKKKQCREVGYNYCERCGDIINVDLHHTLPVAKYGMGAVDEDSHLLFCPGCHMALHRECA